MARRLSRLGPSSTRGGRFAALVLAVIAIHGCVTRELADRMQDFALAAQMPARLEVAYVRILEPEAPPVVAPAPAPAPVKRRVPRVRAPKPASAPQPSEAAEAALAAASAASAASAAPSAVASAESMPPAASEPQASADAASAAAPEPVVAAASAPVAAEASAPAVAAASAAASAAATSAVADAGRPASAAGTGEPFDWPASTRVSFVLTGNYRGEVNGNAQVEWIRVGTHYQVNLDLLVGPDFAPIITRRMSSEGELTSEGLTPSRYDEDTKVVFRERRRVSVFFQPEGVVLANGQRRERWPGVQDTASQFVQLTYLFTTRPELLKVGGTVEVPLALPRNIDRWTYDVLEETVIQTPFGPLATFHLKPRRATTKSGDLSAEIWFAPQLRYLPVRIRIEQDPQTYLDLVIARKPELASR